MADSFTLAILAGLTQGVNEGLAERRQRVLQEEELKLKEQELLVRSEDNELRRQALQEKQLAEEEFKNRQLGISERLADVQARKAGTQETVAEARVQSLRLKQRKDIAKSTQGISRQLKSFLELENDLKDDISNIERKTSINPDSTRSQILLKQMDEKRLSLETTQGEIARLQDVLNDRRPTRGKEPTSKLDTGEDKPQPGSFSKHEEASFIGISRANSIEELRQVISQVDKNQFNQKNYKAFLEEARAKKKFLEAEQEEEGFAGFRGRGVPEDTIEQLKRQKRLKGQ